MVTLKQDAIVIEKLITMLCNLFKKRHNISNKRDILKIAQIDTQLKNKSFAIAKISFGRIQKNRRCAKVKLLLLE